MARLLTVFPDHPYPLDMGSRVRNFRILEALASQFELTIVTLVHDRARLLDPGPVAALGRWVPVLAPHRRGRRQQVGWHLKARWSALHEGLHRETFFQSFPALSQEAARRLETERPDLVHVAYWYSLRHLRPRPRPPLWVVDTHDVQFLRHEKLFGRHAPREKARELSELARYDCVVAITEHDRDVFRETLPDGQRIEMIGMGLDLNVWRPDAVMPALLEAPRVAFYGNLSTETNRQAALHLLEDLVPPLRARIPDLEVLVVGADPPAQIRDLASAVGGGSLRVTGFVEDVRPWLRSARVLALPLRVASGQRGRVVEALALGVPVVSYPGGVVGLELRAGEGLQLAESPEAFQHALLRLLERPEDARALGEAGRARVAERYSLAATYARFPVLYRELLAKAPNESS